MTSSLEEKLINIGKIKIFSLDSNIQTSIFILIFCWYYIFPSQFEWDKLQTWTILREKNYRDIYFDNQNKKQNLVKICVWK